MTFVSPVPEYCVITQDFGVNPANYAKWSLPGHEGIDYAPTGAWLRENHTPQTLIPIYAVADGTVYLAARWSGNKTKEPYGFHVRLDHGEGLKTVYAHMAYRDHRVKRNQVVKAGEIIGFMGSTGNSTGLHLHLTVKVDGATARGETPYPYDIVDPRPYFLEKLETQDELTFNDYQTAAFATAIFHGTPVERISYSALGLTGEAGEVADKVKKILRGDSQAQTPEYRALLVDELGDVLWYLNALAGELGVSLQQVAARNIEKLAARAEAGSLQGEGDIR